MRPFVQFEWHLGGTILVNVAQVRWVEQLAAGRSCRLYLGTPLSIEASIAVGQDHVDVRGTLPDVQDTLNRGAP